MPLESHIDSSQGNKFEVCISFLWERFEKIPIAGGGLITSRAPRLHSFHRSLTPSLRLFTSGNNQHSQAKSLLCTQGRVKCYGPHRLVHDHGHPD